MLKYKQHIAIVLVTMIVLIILSMLSYTGLRMAERNTPLIDAAMEIKYELSLFHLWFEEMIQGDSSVTEAKVWQHLEESRWYANAMLNGGQNSEGVFIPLEAPQLRKLITTSLTSIEILRHTADKRLQNSKSSQAGSTIDQVFDNQFKLALSSADQVESALQQFIQDELENYRILSQVLALIIFLMGAVILIIFNKYNKSNSQLHSQLSDINKNLESKIEKRTQELSKALSLADDSNQAKSIFVSSMSHELRTPLNAILGFSQLIEMDAQDEITKESSQEIIKAGSHLSYLIDEVLNLSKIELGVVEFSSENVSVDKLLQDTLALMKSLAEKNSVEIINNVNTSLNIKVDKMRFKQVLINILSNAILYNRVNGKVIVDFSVERNALVLSITDTGEGLTDAQRIKIFQPFDRAGLEGSNIQGAGLGLSVSKKLIELMKGAIAVESTVGKGSCFTIKVPLA